MKNTHYSRRPRHESYLPRQYCPDRYAVFVGRQLGLTYVVDWFKGWNHSGHVTLQRGERSRLADYAAEVL